ncbi:helix-turn-helix transcriptional regulator [bacterium]|nr:helix-turn-helix transcriptional regulator [bacterium]
MRHVLLLQTLLLLFAGAVIIGYLSQRFKAYNYKYLKPILYHLFFYNMLVLLMACSLYFKLNFNEQSFVNTHSGFKLFGYILGYIVLICTAWATCNIYFGFTDKKVPQIFSWTFWIVTTILMILEFIKYKLQLQNQILPWLTFISEWITDNAPIIELIFLGLLYRRARKLSHSKERKMIMAFVLIYLSRFLVLLAVLPLPKILPVLFFAAFLISGSALPLIWFKYYFLPYEQQRQITNEQKPLIEQLVECYGISRREKEILELILRGKTNPEIEEKLFISYHTVKNHVYKIFQKMGVSNRYELMHLASHQDEA